MLTEGMGQKGVAGSKSDVVGSQKRSVIALVGLWRASPEGTLRDIGTLGNQI
jgi:hypothetical protein